MVSRSEAFLRPLAWPSLLIGRRRGARRRGPSSSCSRVRAARPARPRTASLAELARQPDVDRRSSFPVDYWDYLGWKDTLAHSAFTARQAAYAHLRGDRQVYTPQMIVNGKKPCIGSDRALSRPRSRPRAPRADPARPTSMSRRQNGTVTIIGHGTTPRRRSRGWRRSGLCRSLAPRPSRSAAARTAAAPMTYANVVRGMIRVGEWSGGHARYRGVRSTSPAARATAMWCCCRHSKDNAAQRHSRGSEEQGPLRPRAR